MDDDLNVSAALAALFELVRELNRRIADRSLSTGDAARALGFVRDLAPDRALLMPEGTLDFWSDELLELVDLA